MTISRADAQTKRHRKHVAAVFVTVAVAVGLSGCGQTTKMSRSGKSSLGSSGEIDPRLGVAASPRMVEHGKPVPKGGGRVMVGKPYVVGGKRYYPQHDPDYSAVGMASWYGNAFHGRKTANGEIFDSNSLSAAHTTMPLPSYARVTNMNNGRSVIVRVNDRGPFHSNRVLDMSRMTADLLGIRRAGIGKVKVDYVGPAPVAGSDDRYLMASYRGPSDVELGVPETMVASNDSEDMPGVITRGLSSVVALATPAPEAPVAEVAAAAPVSEDAGFGAPEEIVAATRLPPARPISYASYVVVATADPALSYLAANPVQMAAVDPAIAAATTTTAFVQPAAPSVDDGLQTGSVTPSNYAATRVNDAYSALDALASATNSAPSLAVIEVGVFSKLANAEAIAKHLQTFGVARIEAIDVNGKTMQRVRLVAKVDPGFAIDAATKAGAIGARLVP